MFSVKVSLTESFIVINIGRRLGSRSQGVVTAIVLSTIHVSVNRLARTAVQVSVIETS